GTADNVYIKSNALQKMGPATINVSPPSLPSPLSATTNRICLRCLIQAAENGEMFVVSGN
ncbi:hypothetical protein J3U05_04530, partial [Gilliamella sp. B2737]